MQRAVTAIYRTADLADLVRQEVEQLGIAGHNVTVLSGTGGTSGSTDRLHDLGLPEEDVRTYQQALQNGDYVVSVEVDDDAHLGQVQEIMRRPEDAYGFNGAKRTSGSAVHEYSGTRTVAAVFDSQSEAGRAVTRLRGAGVPDACIRVTPTATEQADLQAYGDQHKRFFESIKDLSLPEEDTHTFVEAMTRGGFLVTVHDFDPGLHDTIIDCLDTENSVDLDSREAEWRSAGWSGFTGSAYSREGGTASAGLGATLGRMADRVGDALTGDSNTRGTIYDDGMQDRNLQMAADAGRRSQADLGSQQAGYAASGSMNQTTGMGTSTADLGATGYRDEDMADDGTVKVVEERLNVGKREVEGGRVRVRSYVREEPVSADVDLRSERVYVERRPVDRAVTAGDMDLGDRTLEARETREEAVVGKEARVVEEIGLRKETEVEHQRIQDTVRKTEVEIEDERTGDRTRLSGDDMTGGSGRF